MYRRTSKTSCLCYHVPLSWNAKHIVSVNFCQTTRRHIPADSNLHIYSNRHDEVTTSGGVGGSLLAMFRRALVTCNVWQMALIVRWPRCIIPLDEECAFFSHSLRKYKSLEDVCVKCFKVNMKRWGRKNELWYDRQIKTIGRDERNNKYVKVRKVKKVVKTWWYKPN